MRKHVWHVLLCGAMMCANASMVVSCGDDDDNNFEDRIAALEDTCEELCVKLDNAAIAGATITDVSEADGVYTLVLSNGSTIVIEPSAVTGGGDSVSIVVSDKSVVITINGTDYELPLGAGAAVNSLTFSPFTSDGILNVGDPAGINATAYFLARPALSAEELKDAKFSIAESHPLTRAGNGVHFRVEAGSVTLEEGLIKLSISPTEAEAGATYAVALQMNYRGTVIGSNYFTIKVDNNYVPAAEEPVNVTFAEGITDAADLGNGFKTATLPASVDFLGEFNFNDLITLEGVEDKSVIEYKLGSNDDQNQNVKDRYDFFAGCLSENGKWKMTGRPGTNCDAPADNEKDGLLVLASVNGMVKAKIYWKVIDPLAGVELKGAADNVLGGHLEYGTPAAGDVEAAPIVVDAGAHELNLHELLMNGRFSWTNGCDVTIEAYRNFSVTFEGAPGIYCGSENLEASAALMKYAKFSRGICWRSVQTSLISSERRGQEIPGDEAEKIEQFGGLCNAEVINGWDGMTAEQMTECGLEAVTADGHFNTTADYQGWGVRIGVGIQFEYDYGVKELCLNTNPAWTGGSPVLMWFFINRRMCPADLKDKPARN